MVETTWWPSRNRANCSGCSLHCKTPRCRRRRVAADAIALLSKTMMVNVAAETECIKSYRFFDTFATFERLWWGHGGITFLYLLSGVEKNQPARRRPTRVAQIGRVSGGERVVDRSKRRIFRRIGRDGPAGVSTTAGSS